MKWLRMMDNESIGSPQVKIDWEVYKRLKYLGIIHDSDDVRSFNVGMSDYSKHTIQPWSIWIDYSLDPWDADIVKRVLRDKEGEPRELDYEKIIHDCQEKLRQINEKRNENNNN